MIVILCFVDAIILSRLRL